MQHMLKYPVTGMEKEAHGMIEKLDRSRVNGFLDAEIRGVFHGDLSAVMESGAYQEESQKEEPPHEEHP